MLREMHSGAGPAGAAGSHGSWTQVEAGFTWSDLVLPESQEAMLQSASATIESGGRLRLLFTGGPGTGKTMACQILGARSDAPVLSLDVSGKDAVDVEAAEELLRAAGRVGAVVVLDHADVLLHGRRVSRSAEGLDADAVLARASAHGGAVVFTSTSTRAVKHELLEQFDCVIDFPFPDARARVEIWRRLLPGDAVLSDEDLGYVAESFQLPGVTIRECCTLAILAAEAQATRVTLAHVARALELEYGDRLAGDSTIAALGELRRRAGVEDVADLPPSPIEPPRMPARRLRPALRMPGRPHAPRIAGGARRLLRPALVAIAAVLIAGAGFIAGRVTSSQRARPAAAKRVAAPVPAAAPAAVSTTTPAATAPQLPPAATPSGAYGAELASVTVPLRHTRSILGNRLRRTPSWTVAAAQAAQLAAVYTTAAARLRAFNAGSAATANAALAAAFAQMAAAFDALRRAAAQPQPRPAGHGDGGASAGEPRRRGRLRRAPAPRLPHPLKLRSSG